MTRSKPHSSPHVEIVVDGGQILFQPGDTITGKILRAAPAASSRAWLTIQLHGRSKTKIVINTFQGAPIEYRGRYNLFKPSETTTRLFDGPLHIADSQSREWPFTIDIPWGVDPVTVAAKSNQRSSYLPLTRLEVADHALPPVFYTFGTSQIIPYLIWEGFIEYTLRAELHIESSSGKMDVHKALLPINIMSEPNLDLMSAVNRPTGRSFLCSISGYRLEPGLASTSLSLPQRTHQFFALSRVPCLTFSLQVEHPIVLQVSNEQYIPFRLLVIPEPEQTTASIRDATPQTVVLSSMMFEIKATTNMICPADNPKWKPKTAHQTRKFDFDLKTAIEQMGEPIVLPTGEKAEPLDIGALLQLSMGNAPSVPRRSISRRKMPLFPTFTTYNIKHTHRLKWGLKLTVAGEWTEVSDEMDVTLMPGNLDELPPYEGHDEANVGEAGGSSPPSPLEAGDVRGDGSAN